MWSSTRWASTAVSVAVSSNRSRGATVPLLQGVGLAAARCLHLDFRSRSINLNIMGKCSAEYNCTVLEIIARCSPKLHFFVGAAMHDHT